MAWRSARSSRTPAMMSSSAPTVPRRLDGAVPIICSTFVAISATTNSAPPIQNTVQFRTPDRDPADDDATMAIRLPTQAATVRPWCTCLSSGAGLWSLTSSNFGAVSAIWSSFLPGIVGVRSASIVSRSGVWHIGVVGILGRRRVQARVQSLPDASRIVVQVRRAGGRRRPIARSGRPRSASAAPCTTAAARPTPAALRRERTPTARPPRDGRCELSNRLPRHPVAPDRASGIDLQRTGGDQPIPVAARATTPRPRGAHAARAPEQQASGRRRQGECQGSVRRWSPDR